MIEEVMKDIGNALMKSDVNIKHVMQMKMDVKKELKKAEDLAKGTDKRKYIKKLVMDSLVQMLSGKKERRQMQKGKPNVVMFVGLQGAGKTTSVTKFGHYYARKGWKVALVGADTFRAGAFDQLKQNATKVKIPFYGSYTETDASIIAQEGVEKFRKERYELIIVDTSGRHKQEDALFDEMREVQEACEPDEVIFVMDSHMKKKSTSIIMRRDLLCARW